MDQELLKLIGLYLVIIVAGVGVIYWCLDLLIDGVEWLFFRDEG